MGNQKAWTQGDVTKMIKDEVHLWDSARCRIHDNSETQDPQQDRRKSLQTIQSQDVC